jgi:RNA polymerase sigma-70 factor, ECF subfamily
LVERSAFQRFVESKSTDEATPLYLADLYLAYACAQGSGAAITAFLDTYGAVAESVRSRFGARAPTQSELRADLQNHLFVARDNGLVRILGFGGQSELKSWLRVVVTRLLLNRLETQKPEDELDERLIDGLELGARNPEYQLQREQSRELFRASFSEAVAALPARDRKLLRMSFAEGLTIDDIGALYGLHRATAFRHVQQASERLSDELQRRLQKHLNLTDSEYDRWCASIRNSLDLSLGRVLKSVE